MDNQQSCLYQGHGGDSRIVKYLLENGFEDCITCTKNDYENGKCKNHCFMDADKKRKLINEIVDEYFELKMKFNLKPLVEYEQFA